MNLNVMKPASREVYERLLCYIFLLLGSGPGNIAHDETSIGKATKWTKTHSFQERASSSPIA